MKMIVDKYNCSSYGKGFYSGSEFLFTDGNFGINLAI